MSGICRAVSYWGAQSEAEGRECFRGFLVLGRRARVVRVDNGMGPTYHAVVEGFHLACLGHEPHAHLLAAQWAVADPSPRMSSTGSSLSGAAAAGRERVWPACCCLPPSLAQTTAVTTAVTTQAPKAKETDKTLALAPRPHILKAGCREAGSSTKGVDIFAQRKQLWPGCIAIVADPSHSALLPGCPPAPCM